MPSGEQRGQQGPREERNLVGTPWAQTRKVGGPHPSTDLGPDAEASGGHLEAEVFPQLLQKHEGEHSVWNQTNASRKESLGKEQEREM